MSDDRFSEDIRRVLDGAKLEGQVSDALRQRRQLAISAGLERKQAWYQRLIEKSFQSIVIPVAATAMLLLAVFILMPQFAGQDAEDLTFGQMAELSSEDLEILVTLEPEELEDLDFFAWLQWQEEQS